MFLGSAGQAGGVQSIARALLKRIKRKMHGAVQQRDAADEGRLEAGGSIIVGNKVIVNHGEVVRPSQLIASVRQTTGVGEERDVNGRRRTEPMDDRARRYPGRLAHHQHVHGALQSHPLVWPAPPDAGTTSGPELWDASLFSEACGCSAIDASFRSRLSGRSPVRSCPLRVRGLTQSGESRRGVGVTIPRWRDALLGCTRRAQSAKGAPRG